MLSATRRARAAAVSDSRGAAGARSGASTSLLPFGHQSLHLIEHRLRHLLLPAPAHPALALRGDDNHLVGRGVEADVRARYVVDDDRVQALVGELAPRALHRLAV